MKKRSLTRRSFIKKTSAGLAGAALTAGLSSSLYGNVIKKASTLAILGGTPVRTKPFLSGWPIFDYTEEKAMNEALHSGRWGVGGKRVPAYEKEFAKAHNVPYCVAVTGGTVSLVTSLAALDIGPGDEVITTPTTISPTINCITNLFALPVFIDIDPESGAPNYDLLEGLITEDTKAILPVHLGGYPEDITRIMSIANKYNIPVVEDACQSVFAEVNNQKVGTFGATGCISFQSSKALNCGEGGAILGSDEELMIKCAAYKHNGIDPTRKRSGYAYPGSQFRMNEFNGAIITEQFKKYKEQHLIRGINGNYLTEKLTEIPGINRPKRIYPSTTRVTYYYPTLFDYDRTKLNNVPASTFAKAVQAEGISIIRGGGGDRKIGIHQGGGCHTQGMIEAHLNSRGFQAVYSKARLRKYRESLKLPVLDNYRGIERLTFRGKTGFLGTKKDIDDIIEAVVKVAKNVDKLA